MSANIIQTPYPAGAALGLPANDDFNRTDSALSLGTATSGHIWTPLGSSTWGINSNKAYLPNVTGLKPAYLEVGAADVTIEVKLNKTDATNTLNRMGIAFRITDTANFLYAYFLVPTSLRLFKLVTGSGSGVEIGSAAVTGANNDVLKVVTSGNQISVFQNGVLKIGPITESHNQTATKHGLFFEVGGQSNTICRWDDFSIV